MSLASGVVKKLSYKDWPPNDKHPEGNRTYSVLLQDAAGGEQWFTNYAYEKHGQPPEGASIQASVEQKGKYPYFTDFEIVGAVANATPAKAPAVGSAPAPVSEGDTWHVKDINIAAQAAFKAICGGLASTVTDEAGVKNCAKIAMDISIYWDKRARACVNGADINELKRNLADDIAEKVNTEGVLPGSTGAFEPGVPPNEGQVQDLDNQALNGDFDDSIPF